mgnify:CR=1 FL=1
MTVDALKELFNTTMTAAQLTIDADPCVNDVHMASDSRFSFVEFRSAHETSNALVLDGMQLLGKPLRVARPNDYQPAPAELVQVLIPASVSATVTSSSVPGQANGMLGLLGAGGVPGLAACGSLASPLTTALATGQVGLPGMAGSGALGGISGASLAALSAGAAASIGASTPGNHLALTRRARRLHVGNLPTGVGLTPDMIKQFFNAALVSANLHDQSKEGDPVLDIMLGTESKFGFVEFRTIAEANSCMALNNIELGGKQLRIERPRDYAPMPESMTEELKRYAQDPIMACGTGGAGVLCAYRVNHASHSSPSAPAVMLMHFLPQGGRSGQYVGLP